METKEMVMVKILNTVTMLGVMILLRVFIESVLGMIMGIMLYVEDNYLRKNISDCR